MSAPASPLRVGLNLVFLHHHVAGIRVVATQLARAVLEASVELRDLHFRVFTTADGEACFLEDARVRDAMAALGPRLKTVKLALNPRRKLAKLAVEQLRLGRLAGRMDVLHSFDYTFPYVSTCRNIVTIHDLNYLNHPETFSWSQRWIRRLAVPMSVRRADAIITISQAARDEIVSRFPTARDRAVTIHNGYSGFEPRAGSVHLPPASEPGEGSPPYILAVGTLKVHKNYPRLLEGIADSSHDDLKLVIVGRDDGIGRDLLRKARDLGIEDRVRLAGFVSDDGLRQLYRQATLFVAPSLYEGFGMPVLEAMAQGVPVACSDLAVFREIGGEAAVYFSPEDASSIRRALDTLLDDPGRVASLVEAGFERIRRFTWEASAQRVLRLYRELVDVPDRTRGRTSEP